MTAIVIAAIGGIVALVAALFGGKALGKSQATKELQPQIDLAKQQTQNVVTESQVKDAEVKQAAQDQTAKVDAIVKNIDARVDALPEGDAAKELEDKYSADK